MRITIYIILLVIMSLSGLSAAFGASTSEKSTAKDNKETENVIDTCLKQANYNAKANKELYGRLVALAVFVVSLAAILTMYIAGGAV